MAASWKTEDKIKLRITLKNQRLLRFMVKYYFVFCFGLASVFSSFRLYSTYITMSDNYSLEPYERPTYFPASKFFFNAQISPVYEIIWLFQAFLCYTAVTIICSYFSLFILTVIHECNQLDVLKTDINNLMLLSDNKTFESRIKIIVENHVQLRK